jgi:hypothetical protein
VRVFQQLTLGEFSSFVTHVYACLSMRNRVGASTVSWVNGGTRSAVLD